MSSALGGMTACQSGRRKFFSGNAFFYIDSTQVCPICGESLEQKQISGLSDYIKEHPKVYLVYFGRKDEEEIVVHL